ncbi:MAG: SusD/RagB family nutrient-binding outer membrane lipoprotein [Gemmatimonadota bacterium]|nr:SusD/RagB family nutrient-binding outer membrane lipoprotein [Gemmatimonadota bacterium]
MISINKLTCAAGIALVAGAVACNNDSLTNLNNNPNNPTSAPAGPVFTSAARLSASQFVGNNYDLRQTQFVAQHWAEAQYPTEDTYARLDPSSTQNAWTVSYYTQMEDLKKVSDGGLAAKAPGTWGPAQVLLQWNFEYLTDTWGNIPYSKALRGDSTGGSLTPSYDAQKDVYAGMLATLTADAAGLKGAANTLSSGDPIYGGNTAQWAKFANSLRARLAMRLVNVDPATADAQLKAAFTDPAGVFASNADQAKLTWPGDGIYNNPMTDNFSTRDDHRVSKTLANILIASNDPRIKVWLQPVADSSLSGPFGYYGMPNGLTAAVAGTYLKTASRLGSYWYPGATTYGTLGSAANKKNPSFYMTYAELALIEAEAAQRGLGGLTPAQAAGFYTAGITASMTQWGVPAASIATYLAQPSVVYAGGSAGLVQIARQKWLALIDDGSQAWAEWRRTCQPATIAPGPAAVVPYVPRRFYYPTTEYSINPTSVAAAVSAQGADNFATRIYWDTKPTAAPTYVSGAACGS